VGRKGNERRGEKERIEEGRGEENGCYKLITCT
jgi:hypothetical protein